MNILEESSRRLMQRLAEFAEYSDEPDGRLTRLYLSPAYLGACERFCQWARIIGLTPYMDAVGNIRARYEGRRVGAPALMIGSHIDTVRNAGRYDGNLGALAALSVVEMLIQRRERLEIAIEIVAFGDEEGVRFPTAMTGSRALAGMLSPNWLDAKDDDDVSLRDALMASGCSPELAQQARARDVFAFVELHIEQGPRLEAEGLAIGTVTAINGASRLEVRVLGSAGHAGSVPMELRRDALCAAAEMVLAVEREGIKAGDVVGTVGRINALPGAINVIPGVVTFSVDVRSTSDQTRQQLVSKLEANFRNIAGRRGAVAEVTQTHNANAYECDNRIVSGLDAAVAACGQKVFHLSSGAGHDAMIMGQICPAGMLFVRCAGGISHNPLESITLADCEIGLATLFEFVRTVRPDFEAA